MKPSKKDSGSTIPDSGFKNVLSQIRESRRSPLNQKESKNIKEGFRLYAHYLVDIIDNRGRIIR